MIAEPPSDAGATQLRATWTFPAVPTTLDGAPGTVAAGDDVAVTGALPRTVFTLVVVIVAVELVTAATPVTVTKPLPLIATKPDAVAVPAHV